MARTTKKKRWSYSTGERGRNRIRAFEHESGVLHIEYRERGQRKRISLGHRDQEKAKRQADEAAAKLGKAERLKPEQVTLGSLFEMYLGEVTLEKSPPVQKFDRAAAARLKSCLGQHRKASELSRREWDLFTRERRSGRLTGQAVGPRTVARDLKLLSAVLNWATLSGDGRGGILLDRNPLRGLPYPSEKNPKRPTISEPEYQSMLTVAGQVSEAMGSLLILAHETGHRITSICELRWSDVDLPNQTVLWRAENDKQGYESSTPLTREAVGALKRERGKTLGIGDAPVFPSPRDGTKPMSRHLAGKWWRRAEALASLERVPNRGWHSLRRKFGTDLGGVVTTKEIAMLGGWKDAATVLLYQHPSEDRLRQGLEQRRRA